MNIEIKAWSKVLNLFFVQLALFFLFACHPSVSQMPTAHQSTLDLRQWDFDKQGPVKLNGDWAFYWQQFWNNAQTVSPSPTTSYFINLPSDWKNYELKGQRLGGQGYASYALHVLLPENTEEMGINIHTVATAMKLYADDSLIYQAGKVGKNAEETLPEYAPDFVRIPSTKDTLRLILEVSNFHYHRGGGLVPLFFR
ncbi:hypothetical protein WJR50_31645 [Catalinimonas sp. 4WD22]|uniref:hypothetical protein n=1 Tax=Catalinimonas locisalis TaxID=3133978 RepID=UPI003101AA24